MMEGKTIYISITDEGELDTQASILGLLELAKVQFIEKIQESNNE